MHYIEIEQQTGNMFSRIGWIWVKNVHKYLHHLRQQGIHALLITANRIRIYN